ncbi:hypothetical protein [Vibrio cholerae]|uniref:hypothetical protein n=1 Tax=Vibrio cholerae TaxID=666 RepID=UPI002934D30D|nr:hypothetical protein [Vibrio cholerae]MDV2400238.1 hypothetical protein [Vibrio cholerae]
MKQIYALIQSSAFGEFEKVFPNAVILGDFRLGVFVDYELDAVTALTDSWEKFTSLNEVSAKLSICTYEQAKSVFETLNVEGEI